MTPPESSLSTPKGSNIILGKKPTPSSTSKRSYQSGKIRLLGIFVVDLEGVKYYSRKKTNSFFDLEEVISHSRGEK
jgi:hypothetical protein